MEEIGLIYYSSKITVPKGSKLELINKIILDVFPSIQSLDEIELCFFENEDKMVIDDEESFNSCISCKSPIYVLNKSYEERMAKPQDLNEKKIQTLHEDFNNKLSVQNEDIYENQFLENIQQNCFTYESFEQIFDNNLIQTFSPVLQLSTIESEPENDTIHEGTICNICKVEPIKGIMYYCNDCKEKLNFMVCMDCEIRYRHNNCYHPHDLICVIEPIETQTSQKMRNSSRQSRNFSQTFDALREQVINHIYDHSNPLKEFKVNMIVPGELESYPFEIFSDANSPYNINTLAINHLVDKNKEIGKLKEFKVSIFNTKINKMYPGRYIFLLGIRTNKNKLKKYDRIKVILNINLECELVLRE